jgi:ketosteroid isomerase-like protein
MTKRWIGSLVSLSLLLGVVWSQANKGGDTEKAIAGLEQTWLQSQKTNNADLIAPHLADKIVATSSEGKLTDKAQTLADAKKTKWASAEYTDVKVSVFGDTAIATGSFKGKGTDPSGKAIEVTERWTDTWVKMPNGQWQCVATQGTPVKM